MTVRSWDRTQILGPNDVGVPAPYYQQIYAQNGTDTPKALRALGLYQENAYTLNVTDVLWPPMRVSLGTSIFRQTGMQFVAGAPVYHSVVAPVYADVIPRLLNKWRSSDFNAGVSIGEGRESAQMIVQRLRSIADAAKHVRHGNIPAAIGVLVGNSGGPIRNPIKSGRRAERRMRAGDFSGAFLELQLGWLPLIRDIYALAELVKLEPRKRRIRSSAKNSVPSGYVSNGNGELIVLRNEKRLHLVVEVSSQPSIQERLGLTNALIIGWELVPLSFVADWFLPIQKNLETYHALAAMPVTRCIETRVFKKAARVTLNTGQTYGSWKVVSTGGAAKFSSVSMTRSVSSGLPSAWAIAAQTPLSILSDISNWDVDLRKMAIGAALAHQRILKLM